MIIRCLVLLTALLCTVTACGDDGALPLQVLSDLKAATAFLKVSTLTRAGQGSGFVVHVDGRTMYLATNFHVIDPDMGKRPGTGKPNIQAVFNSGGKQERSYAAEMVAGDPRHDLAVLKIDGAENLPAPVAYDHQDRLVETMPIFAFGFPLGELLGINKANPAITVSRGTVSSIRADAQGRVTTVQVSGDFSPGNSGGPVVDSSGRLVGIATAAIRDRPIGFAVPASQLARMLDGQVVDHKFTSRQTEPGHSEVDVNLGVFDPFNRLRSMTFYYVQGDVKQSHPNTKKLAELPNVQAAMLHRLGGDVVARFRVSDGSPVSFQVVFVNGQGRTFVTNANVRRLR